MAIVTPSLANNPMPADLRKAVEQASNTPILGNPKGNVTLTQFFDYNCPACRKMMPEIHKLISEDKQLRVVFREWAVFGEGSDFSARAALASIKQGKYWQFHKAMMSLDGKADEKSAIDVATKLGMDIPRLRKDMQAREVQEHLYDTMDLAEHMALVGTPTFIAGNEGLFGYHKLSVMRGLIERGRAALA